MLTPQGKFLFEFIVIKHKSGFFIDCEKNQSDEIFKQYSNEAALYLSDDFEINDVLKLNIGLRYSSFQHSGDINPISFLTNEIQLELIRDWQEVKWGFYRVKLEGKS